MRRGRDACVCERESGLYSPILALHKHFVGLILTDALKKLKIHNNYAPRKYSTIRYTLQLSDLKKWTTLIVHVTLNTLWTLSPWADPPSAPSLVPSKARSEGLPRETTADIPAER